jgi:hypothetical protein
MENRFAHFLCSIVIAFSISACADNDSTPPPPPTSGQAQGLWNGTTDEGRTVAGLVLDDGTYWFLYSLVGNPNVVAGLVQGNASSQDGSFTSANLKDFNLERSFVSDGSINGNYVSKQTLNGTVTYTNNAGQVTITATYDLDYDLTPDASLLAGTYSGSTGTGLTAGGAENVTVTLTSSGTITGFSASGCIFAGAFAPRAHGNVFDVSVTFAGGACQNGTNTVIGTAFFDTATKKLYSAALNGARTNGFIFIGSKP